MKVLFKLTSEDEYPVIESCEDRFSEGRCAEYGHGKNENVFKSALAAFIFVKGFEESQSEPKRMFLRYCRPSSIFHEEPVSQYYCG